MVEPVLTKFEKYPSRLKVVKLLLEYGFSIIQDKKSKTGSFAIFAGPVELSTTKIARALNVDRKTIDTTCQTIIEDDALYNVFSRLKPIGDITNVARYNKNIYEGVLTITALPSAKGIAALASQLLLEENITIRYMVARDADLSVESTMTIITDKKIPARVTHTLLEHEDIIEVALS